MSRPLAGLVVALAIAGLARADGGMSADEKKLIDLVNAERRKVNLPLLTANDKLMNSARGHSGGMAGKGLLAHTLEGKGPGERLAAVNYTCVGWGENVAAGQRTPAQVVAAWMDSPGHRSNLLGKDFRETGVALARASDGTVYWTQLFAVPGRD